MIVGFGRFDFLVPGSGSLKEKRRATKHLVERLRSRFNASVAEVDHNELWQRGAIGVTCVSNSESHCREMLSQVEKAVRSDHRIEVLDVHCEVISADE